MAGGTLRRHGLSVHGAEFCLVSRGSRARGLLRLALTALQWRGYHGASRRLSAAAAMMWSRIGRRLRLAVKRAQSAPKFLPANPARHLLVRTLGDIARAATG
jgi:hypothetical protein